MPERDLLRTYRDATGPDPAQVARVLGGPPRAPRRPYAGVLGAVVLVGILALVVRQVPAPAEEAPPPEAPPAPVATDIADGASEPLPGLLLAADGVGTIEAGPGHARLVWVVGELRATVPPDVGLDVVTDDAHVHAAGAEVRVVRDALGTDVHPVRGAVDVACGDGAPQPVAEGASRFCLPVQPAGWLGRAQALASRGAPPSEYRAAAEAGLAAGARGSVEAELDVVRIRSLLADKRDDDALTSVRDYLAAGHAERRAEVLALGIGLADRVGACEDARAWAAEADGAALDRCRR